MADSDSVVSAATGTDQDDPLADLTLEQLCQFVEDTERVNEVIKTETEMFEKFLRRVEPKETTTLTQQQFTSPLPQIQEIHVVRGSRKRSKSRSSALDKLLRLTAEQKCDIAQRELEELREEIDKLKEDSERVLDNYRANLEEAEMKIQESKKAFYEFDRDICKGSINPRTNKVIAEKVLRYYEDKLRSRDTLIEKLRLKNSTLRVQKKKLQLQLKQKEEMGEVLHEVDFNQLKIENQQYLEKIDEKNQELLRLKLMAGNTLQVLNRYKKRLLNLTTESKALKTEILTRKDNLVKFDAETIIVEEERNIAEKNNKHQRQKLADFKVPEVQNYVHKKANLMELQKTVKSWERKVEIAQMALNTHKKSWKQIWVSRPQVTDWMPPDFIGQA
uniref:coiled-coil domain-containing protein 113-like n=1 Tax=Styela clava TaxID=7725 RepID=UPI0019396523|nr:coiled-coil domain-containing protein 113-like [Styela clava]